MNSSNSEQNVTHIIQIQRDQAQAFNVYRFLVEVGFKFNETLGYLFPSSDLSDLVALKHKIEKDRIYYPRPQLKVSEVRQQGVVSIEFD